MKSIDPLSLNGFMPCIGRGCAGSGSTAASPAFEKRPGNAPGPSEQKQRKAYFCCSLGLSVGFGGLPWVCCCGVAGVVGACSSDTETGTVVMQKSFHEKN